MNHDTRWLARLGIDHGLITRPQCLQIRGKLGDAADLMAYAQEFIDSGIVTDVEKLEKLADLAITKGEKGPPASDPFDDSDTEAPLVQTGPAAAAGADDDEDDPEPAAAEAPKFAFDSVAKLDDAALATALRELLRDTANFGASDLHLSTGARPFIRKDRALSYLSDYVLTDKDSLRLNTALLAEHQKKTFLEKKDYDYALAVTAAERYRVNLMFHKNGAAGAYRMVPAKVRSLDELGFAQHDATLKKLLSYHNGLILITGPVGSGKTTTLASMVDYLNATRTDHIITVEDPIEVVQPAKGCNVTQREVGPHTKTFFTALKGALREDPDVIIIGELRDLETIEMAIGASETGHLVIGTMHTSDAATTLNRLLDVFPPAQQTQIRASVAESLRGIVCQRLLPCPAGGLTLACEILISNTAIQNLIREGKSTGLRNTMETGVKEGMCLMDNVVFALWKDGRISAVTAQANITNRVLKAKISYMAAIDTLLRQMLEKGGSDLHLTVGLPPKTRASGSLQAMGDQPLDAKTMESLLKEIVPERRWTEFLDRKDLDLAHEIPGLARFRGNYLYNHWGQAAVFRQIPAKILSFDELKLPEALKKLCHLDQGLVVVTGPTGSGKSTTLAAMIDYINSNLAKHIITIEDPIEFVHPVKKCVIVHREVGEHTASFAAALKGAMRHDPDILLLGEMREMETIKLALGCASMGMLVFGTLHTNNAPKTVDRIINTFPADEQNQVRIMLGSCLAGVVAQLLCKRIPKGRCAVHEILLAHEALPNTIRSGQIGNIKSIIEAGGGDGMITMDNSLMNRVKDGTIEPKEAYMKAAIKATFAPLLQPGDLDGGH